MTKKNNNSFFEKKHAIVKKAVEDRKTIVTINNVNGNPIAFDSQKKYDAYKKRLTQKHQAKPTN